MHATRGAARRTLAFTLMVAATTSGCGQIDPSDPDALSQAIIIPGATRVQGSPPSERSGTSGEAPVVDGDGVLPATSGEQSVLTVNYYSPSGYDNCYVQVQGASDYFELPLDSTVTEGQIQIPIEFPSTVGTGDASFYTCIQGLDGGVSNPLTFDVDIINPEGGGGGGGGAVGQCTDSSYVGSCPTLRTCVQAGPLGVGDCWYEAGGRRFDCSASCDCTAAAQAVAEYCL